MHELSSRLCTHVLTHSTPEILQARGIIPPPATPAQFRVPHGLPLPRELSVPSESNVTNKRQRQEDHWETPGSAKRARVPEEVAVKREHPINTDRFRKPKIETTENVNSMVKAPGDDEDDITALEVSLLPCITVMVETVAPFASFVHRNRSRCSKNNYNTCEASWPGRRRRKQRRGRNMGHLPYYLPEELLNFFSATEQASPGYFEEFTLFKNRIMLQGHMEQLLAGCTRIMVLGMLRVIHRSFKILVYKSDSRSGGFEN